MKSLVDVCVIPIGSQGTLTEHIHACHKIFEKAGLSYKLNPLGTTVEGEWGKVFNAIEHCHKKLHHMGVERITTTIKVATKQDSTNANEFSVDD